jgi:hypothetical protein
MSEQLGAVFIPLIIALVFAFLVLMHRVKR